jgi:hypothetical protein
MMTSTVSTNTTANNSMIMQMQNPQDYLVQRAMEISAKLASLEPMPDLDHMEEESHDDATSTTDDETTSEESTAHRSKSQQQQLRRRGSKKIPERRTSKTVATTKTTTTTKTAIRTKKLVCFARNMKDGKIKCTKHLYPLQEGVSVDELWYSQSEIQAIHAESQVASVFHRENSPDYITAIVGLAFSFEKVVTKEKKSLFSKEITKCGDARGLEPSIVEITRSLRAAHIDTVLDAQEELLDKNNKGQHQQQRRGSSSKSLEVLRRKSRETSRPSRQLAFMMAEHDTFEAMKATLLPWK